eukprot:m.77604 g.77604  ORF g.77604 m.77604 type:complete len:2193 (-) comp14553_c0_seq2:73-6651(-)
MSADMATLEKFVLADDRQAELGNLVEGSLDHLFFSVLELLNKGADCPLSQVDRLLEQYLKATNNRGDGRYRELVAKAHLLRYDTKQPKQQAKVCSYLEKELGLHFNHTPVHAGAAAPPSTHPSTIDPALVDGKAVMTKLLKERPNDLNALSDAGIERAAKLKLSDNQRRILLQRLRRPDVPNLVDIIEQDLRSSTNSRFGSLSAHNNLTLEQMDKLLALHPALRQDNQFVNMYILKLALPSDVPEEIHLPLMREYLERLHKFASTLSPAFNTIKANALYHLLKFQSERMGVYNSTFFEEYIKLPKSSPVIAQDYVRSIENRQHLARLGHSLPGLSAVRDDTKLVTEFLTAFFSHKATNLAQPFKQYLDPAFVSRLHAEVQLMTGNGKATEHQHILGEGNVEALRTRSEISLRPQNDPFYHVATPVYLTADIKNVEHLTIKIFEVNVFNYHRDKLQEVSMDINLDGLIPNEELSIDYKQSPICRHRETYELPSLSNRRGVFVVEFIGAGLSSRALVRKGALTAQVSTSTAGQVFRVFNEGGELIKDAALWLDNQQFDADPETHDITLPYSHAHMTKTAVLKGLGISSLLNFEHLSEKYDLGVGVFVDRGAMISNNLAAQAILRPVVTIHGTPVTVEVLENVSSQIEFVDQQGIPTTKQDSNVKVSDTGEIVSSFAVPEQTRSVTFTIMAEVPLLSNPGSPQKLQATKSLEFNSIDGTDVLEDAYLVPSKAGYKVLVLGRTGEPKANRIVHVRLFHAFFNEPIHAELQTDETGAVFLGPLLFVTSAEVSAGNTVRSWNLELAQHTYPSNIHVQHGQPVRVPIMDTSRPLGAVRASLLQTNAGQFLHNRTDVLKTDDAGYLVAEGLPSGEFSLAIKDVGVTHNITIRVERQASSADPDPQLAGLKLVLNPYQDKGSALWQCDRCECQGQDEVFHSAESEYDLCRVCFSSAVAPPPSAQTLELSSRVAPQIVSAAVEGTTLNVDVANATKSSRLHVMRSQFVSDETLYDAVAGPYPFLNPACDRLENLQSHYESGRRLGDEHRYVLERRQLKHKPGNMLDRPSLILAPVELRETETLVQEVKEREAYDRCSEQRSHAQSKQAMKHRRRLASSQTPNLDFLAEPSATLFNVAVPLPEGGAGHTVVQVDLQDLRLEYGGRLTVVLVDDEDAAVRTVALDDAKTQIKTRSLALESALAQDLHFAETREVSPLLTGSSWQSSEGTARKAVYGTVAQAFEVLQTLQRGNIADLRRFEFVAKWHTLTAEQKTKKYSEYSCSELNFFLFKRDGDFFSSVVKPLLTNKLQKSFVDKWLLGLDLAEYTLPSQIAQLNTFEQVLLAQWCDQQGSEMFSLAGLVSKLKDHVLFNPADVERLNYFFDTALKGSNDEPPPPPPPSNALADDLMFDEEDADSASGGEEGFYGGGGGGGMHMMAMAEAMPPPPMAAPMAMAAAAPMAMGMAMPQSAMAPGGGGGRAMARSMRRSLPMHEEKSRKKKMKAKQLAKPGDKAKQIGERNWWEVPTGAGTHLVQPNALWLDYARFLLESRPHAPFVSSNFLQASSSLAEILLNLAVLDVPFDNDVTFAKGEGNVVTILSRLPALVFSKQIRQASPGPESVLLHEHFFDPTDRFTQSESGDQVDKFVTGEFLTFKVYGCRVVMTNSTSRPIKLSALRQIPAGAIPVSNGFFTSSKFLQLGAYSTETEEYFFYFPVTGTFSHYPAHASRNGVLCGHAHPNQLTVVSELATIDTTSWSLVANNGAPEQVLKFLETENLLRANLSELAWRLKDKSFFQAVTTLLRKRCYYDSTVWSYAIHHNDPVCLRELLSHHEHLFGTGAVSSLVQWPAERAYTHTEFNPVINARAHRFAHAKGIPNQTIETAYRALLDCAVRTDGTSTTLNLAVVYHLLLQDRIDDARKLLQRVPPGAPGSDAQLQRDYLEAYLDFYSGDRVLATARAIAGKYAAAPVGVARWDRLFAEISNQITELDSGIATDAALLDGGTSAIAQPSLSLKTKDNVITVSYGSLNSTTAEIKFFAMDLELLFSNNPFVRKNTKQFSYIHPNLVLPTSLPSETNKVDISVPEQYRDSNVLIEISAGGLKASEGVFSSALECQVAETHGHIRVLTAQGDPLPAAYVKVYSKSHHGSEEFYKDGYTDLRGRFDYITLNTKEQLNSAQAFALLVVSESHGSVVLEAKLPTGIAGVGVH